MLLQSDALKNDLASERSPIELLSRPDISLISLAFEGRSLGPASAEDFEMKKCYVAASNADFSMIFSGYLGVVSPSYLRAAAHESPTANHSSLNSKPHTEPCPET